MLIIGRERKNDGKMEVPEAIPTYLNQIADCQQASFFNTSEYVMLLENNSNMYFFIELDNRWGKENVRIIY